MAISLIGMGAGSLCGEDNFSHTTQTDTDLTQESAGVAVLFDDALDAAESPRFSVIPAQYTTPPPQPQSLDLSTPSGTTQSAGLVEMDSPLFKEEMPILANSFNSTPEFDSGVTIVSDNVAVKLGGYVKADLIHDFNAIGSTDTFDTTTIYTDGTQGENVRFHSRQSRLSLDTRWRVSGKLARTFVEGDFFGGDSGSSNFRLRHAYGTLGSFTVGQTWTTFTDPSAVPQTLDMEGAVSNVNRRQGLVRWDQPLFDGRLKWAIAVENPEFDYVQPSMVQGEGRTESPDFITHLRFNEEWGTFQAACVIRELGFQPTVGPIVQSYAWGFNFTGSFLVLERTKGYFQITFGEGVGSYRGSPDAVATGPTTAAILPMFGWMVGVHHEWTDSLTSNLTFSHLSLDVQPGQDPASMADTTYLAVNLIATPYERVFCGIEYLYGIREDVSGARGDANRLQISFGFYLP